MAIASGLKDTLFNNGFTSIDLLLKSKPVELAAILGIDLYAARMIILAAMTHKVKEQLQADFV